LAAEVLAPTLNSFSDVAAKAGDHKTLLSNRTNHFLRPDLQLLNISKRAFSKNFLP